MKKLLVAALLISVVALGACSSANTDNSAKTRSSAVETLPAEDK